MTDEENLRDRLHDVAQRPDDETDVDAVVRRGLRLARRRRAALFTAGSVVAVTAVIIGGVAIAGGSGSNHSRQPALARSHPAPSTSSGDENIAPIGGTCSNVQYSVALNGAALPNRDEPAQLKVGGPIDIEVSPASGQLAISRGTAKLLPDMAASDTLTSADTSPTVSATADATGSLALALPSVTQTNLALPAGHYNLVVTYETPCAAKQYVGGEIDLSVVLS